jgi:hypothetical protein
MGSASGMKATIRSSESNIIGDESEADVSPYRIEILQKVVAYAFFALMPISM